jgi:3-methyladenine DNA glycosylase AlkD
MKAQEARELGERIAALVREGQIAQAYEILSPILARRTPFAMLRHIGAPVGTGPPEPVNAFLERIAAHKTEGGWVVIAGALKAQLDRDLAGSFARCREFIIAADVWYAADTLGEGVVGEALVARFQPALDLLTSWREDDDPWVRRSAGTGVHFWAKRSRGAAEHAARAETLLAFLEPMFGEWDMTAVKGIGWGLKTLGKHYPDLVADWLAQQIVPGQRRHRALMLRKALTYLSDEQRARATGGVS